MTRRVVYERLTPAQFSGALSQLGYTARQFARLSGSDDRRVVRWLKGEEDIPVVVAVLVVALTASRKALDVAEAYIETAISTRS